MNLHDIKKEQFYVQWSMLPAKARNGNGNPDDFVSRECVPGKTWQWSITSGWEKPIIWLRYIDDIFAIWPHGEGNLTKLIDEINSYPATIKFIAEWSKESVVLLDTRLIRESDKLILDLYTKPTNTHQYLHRRSCHPAHCKNSIAYSQALRLRRICSRDIPYIGKFTRC